jgi:hypothetical protein
MLNEINLMLEPRIVKIQHWIFLLMRYGLEDKFWMSIADLFSGIFCKLGFVLG